jgi:LmbE family N-acetylglucosaminyl deacetylase
MSLIPWYHPTAQPLLVVAPHPDDEAIGCGGLLSCHSRLGGESTVLYLTRTEERRWQEAFAARSHLAVKQVFELNLAEGEVRPTEDISKTVKEILRKIQPRSILLPAPGDPHPDHRNAHSIFAEALSAATGQDLEVVFYEGFTPICNANAWLDITSVAHQKWAALACYESQQERYRIVEIAQHLNAFRAITTMRKHVEFAEAFRRLTVSEYLQCQ